MTTLFGSRHLRYGGHVFTMIDVGRVKRGIANARCRHCTCYAKAYSTVTRRTMPARPNCPDCKAARTRLTVLKKWLEKEGLLDVAQ